MDAQKRNFEQTSPDGFVDNTPKKHYLCNSKMIHNTLAATNSSVSNIKAAAQNEYQPPPAAPVADCFSWAMFDMKLNSALDAKLECVVKKEDLVPISTEIQQLRNENNRLQKELQVVKSRLEIVDKASRRNNIVVSGFKSSFVPEILNEFKEICATTLKVSVNIVEARRIASGKSLLLVLNSPLEVNDIIAVRRRLAGTNIYIDKDFTAEERSNRYFLRQIGKSVKKADKHAKVRQGDHRVFINDKPFSCVGEKIIASNKSDAESLRKLLSTVNFECVIDVKPQHYSTVPAPAPESSSDSNLK